MITLPEDHTVPLYQSLYLQLRQEIQTGALPCGKKLPSKRKLSEQLGVSVNTVHSAYCQLEAEALFSPAPAGASLCWTPACCPRSSSPPHSPRHRKAKSAPDWKVDFSPSGMARQQFPFGVWRRLMKNCFNEYDESLLLRTQSQGDPGLRTAVADYLYPLPAGWYVPRSRSSLGQEPTICC